MQYLAFFLQEQPSLGSGLLPIIVVIGIFYFLVFMPMQKQKKKTAEMLAGLQAGNEVLTTGGIIGTITGVKDDRVVVRVKPDNIKLEIARNAVASLVGPEKELEEKS